jgi:hypothetical protein
MKINGEHKALKSGISVDWQGPALYVTHVEQKNRCVWRKAESIEQVNALIASGMKHIMVITESDLRTRAQGILDRL